MADGWWPLTADRWAAGGERTPAGAPSHGRPPPASPASRAAPGPARWGSWRTPTGSRRRSRSSRPAAHVAQQPPPPPPDRDRHDCRDHERRRGGTEPALLPHYEELRDARHEEREGHGRRGQRRRTQQAVPRQVVQPRGPEVAAEEPVEER